MGFGFGLVGTMMMLWMETSTCRMVEPELSAVGGPQVVTVWI